MAKHIKLEKEILDCFRKVNMTKRGIESILYNLGKEEKELWEKIIKKYNKYDLTGAVIDPKEEELIIPFSDL